ncbi:hypothetical protein ACNQQN_00040 [Mycobacteroides chelonae]|uniref:hypothetical protein n=1 Tax=Mycobacteroides chelonae TaxID=1774 RepID=UPI003AB06001
MSATAATVATPTVARRQPTRPDGRRRCAAWRWAPPTGQGASPERARSGEDIACTVYFNPGTDLNNSDELTVRGKRYPIIVNDWMLSGRGGLEVLCSRGQG